MKVYNILKELETKECFREFKDKYTDSYLTALFVILSSEEKEGDSLQVDFFIESEKKIATFEYPFNSYKVHPDEINVAKKINNFNLKVDVHNLRESVEAEFKKSFRKIMGILQGDLWNVTCFSGLNIKRIKINAVSGEVVSSGDLNPSDVMRIIKKP